jgi:MFS transporter, Spinster family, sphingosine-1-phosphate transporter
MTQGFTRNEARFALALLFGVNFLNYIDRYVIAAVLPLIQRDFAIGDAQAGLLAMMFMVVYMVASPFTGVMGDRFPRRYLVGGGVILWSLATAASGLAGNFHQLLAARSLIGIGEAGFGAVAPTLISDFFAKEKRGRMLAYFYVAIPVGSALGYLLGGVMGEHFGWRSAFFVAGVPGVLIGIATFFMKEPARGAGDGVRTAERTFEPRQLLGLLKNRTYVMTTFGFSAMTFALGGMAYWMPKYFNQVKGLPLDTANMWFGGMTVVSGLVGTFLGGWAGDWLLKRTPRAYLLVSGIGMIVAVPATLVGLYATQPAVYMPAWFFAELGVFLNTGPANAVFVNVVVPEIRATAIALSIFVYHLLGDATSPWLIGKVSDATGNLGLALSLTSAAMLLSGILYLIGSRTLPEDTDLVLRTVAARETEGAAPS